MGRNRKEQGQGRCPPSLPSCVWRGDDRGRWACGLENLPSWWCLSRGPSLPSIEKKKKAYLPSATMPVPAVPTHFSPTTKEGGWRRWASPMPEHLGKIIHGVRFALLCLHFFLSLDYGYYGFTLPFNNIIFQIPIQIMMIIYSDGHGDIGMDIPGFIHTGWGLGLFPQDGFGKIQDGSITCLAWLEKAQTSSQNLLCTEKLQEEKKRPSLAGRGRRERGAEEYLSISSCLPCACHAAASKETWAGQA